MTKNGVNSMNKPANKEQYKIYKDKRFTLSDDMLAIIHEGVSYHLYYVSEKVNNFIIAGIKSYKYDKEKKKLVDAGEILTVGLN
jgi:hypothetical protein